MSEKKSIAQIHDATAIKNYALIRYEDFDDSGRQAYSYSISDGNGRQAAAVEN